MHYKPSAAFDVQKLKKNRHVQQNIFSYLWVWQHHLTDDYALAFDIANYEAQTGKPAIPQNFDKSSIWYKKGKCV